MHSSRMRTVCSLTVFPGSLPPRGVYSPLGVCLPVGVPSLDGLPKYGINGGGGMSNYVFTGVCLPWGRDTLLGEGSA